MPNLRIFLFFFVAAIAGTLLHECGHALVAWFYGFHPQVHYAYCISLSETDWQLVKEGKIAYSNYPHHTWILLGGPLQTILTGSVGFSGLWVLSRRTLPDAYNAIHLFWIVLTYFHSRWIFNSAGILYKLYVSGKESRSDEVRLMNYWSMNVEMGTWLLLLISGMLLAYTTFVLVKLHRWPLIIYGGLGSIAGARFWLGIGGKFLMP